MSSIFDENGWGTTVPPVSGTGTRPCCSSSFGHKSLLRSALLATSCTSLCTSLFFSFYICSAPGVFPFLFNKSILPPQSSYQLIKQNLFSTSCLLLRLPKSWQELSIVQEFAQQILLKSLSPEFEILIEFFLSSFN